MPNYIQYIRSNGTNIRVLLDNWIYRTSDKFEIVVKFNSIVYDWAGIMGTNYTNSPAIYIQTNYWGGRSVINFTHSGAYTGDGAVLCSAVRNNTLFCRIVGDGNNFSLYNGSDEKAEHFERSFLLGTVNDTDTQAVTLFALNPNGGQISDHSFYGLKVWRDGELIHDYRPIEDGIYDKVTSETFNIVGTGYINGPPVITDYTIAYNANGGFGEMSNQIIDIDVPTALSANTFERINYIFKGWALTPHGKVVYTDQEFVTNIAEAGTITILYAVWEFSKLEIEFSNNKSDERQIYKTLVNKNNLIGTLRDASSIIHPVIMVELDEIPRYNFCYISKFRRYYYIRNIESYRKNLWIITLECDVLMSFKNDIALCEVVVDKQTMAINGDEYIDDNSLVSDNYMYNTVYNFTGDGFSENPTYILITAG